MPSEYEQGYVWEVISYIYNFNHALAIFWTLLLHIVLLFKVQLHPPPLSDFFLSYETYMRTKKILLHHECSQLFISAFIYNLLRYNGFYRSKFMIKALNLLFTQNAILLIGKKETTRKPLCKYALQRG